MTKYAIQLQNGKWLISANGKRLTFSRYVDAFNARQKVGASGRVIEVTD